MENGTPEATVFSAVPPEGITLAALKVRSMRRELDILLCRLLPCRSW